MFLGSMVVYYTIAGFLVGALIGVTGVGGGSLMTPILIVLFGVPPATAVGTDLLFAAATKAIGSIVHGFNRTIEWRIVRRLAIGSMPATALALVVLSSLHMNAGGARHVITVVLSIALLSTAAVLIARDKIHAVCAPRLNNLDDRSIAGLTIAIGAALGILVTFSSIGAGAIGVTVLVLFYPRLSTKRIVGSDIAHAVPLTLVAGLAHGAMRSIDLHILLWLLLGSSPGILVGCSISGRLRDAALRYALAAVLAVVGGKLALDIPAQPKPSIAAARTTHIPLNTPYATPEKASTIRPSPR